MSQCVYEGLFLLDSNRYARDAAGVTAQLTETVESCGGEMLVSRLWNEQKLAYPIKGHRKGTYWLTLFRMDSQRQRELARKFRLNDSVLRNLVLKVDSRLVDTLVRHASGTAVTAPPETAAAAVTASG